MPTNDILTQVQREFRRVGWTYDRFAAESGVSRTTISTYLNNPPKKPRPATVKVLADTLGIDASAIPETNEQPENASEMFMVNHCTACRAVTAAHNEELRQDFNARFADMKKAYEDHEQKIIEQYEKRLAKAKSERDAESRKARLLLWIIAALTGTVTLLTIIEYAIIK
jgi:transcriptional regulator with XRE-family HTH domain